MFAFCVYYFEHCFFYKEKKHLGWDFTTVIFGALLSFLLRLDLNQLEYYQPVYIGGGTELHSLISAQYSISFYLPAVLFIICLCILCAWQDRIPPALTALFIGGVLVGNAFELIYTIHLLGNAGQLGCFWLLIFYPLNYFLLSIRVCDGKYLMRLNILRKIKLFHVEHGRLNFTICFARLPTGFGLDLLLFCRF